MAARRSDHGLFGEDGDEMADASLAGEGKSDLSLDDLGDDLDFDSGDVSCSLPALTSALRLTSPSPLCSPRRHSRTQDLYIVQLTIRK